jgi:hypothetical protein
MKHFVHSVTFIGIGNVIPNQTMETLTNRQQMGQQRRTFRI